LKKGRAKDFQEGKKETAFQILREKEGGVLLPFKLWEGGGRGKQNMGRKEKNSSPARGGEKREGGDTGKGWEEGGEFQKEKRKERNRRQESPTSLILSKGERKGERTGTLY